uniref:neuronal pentraxin-1 n=1 Tax=Solea senegalensis TaxID=28829 RepID=UPI001CD846A9|nr:neuronal pentraxin-1 [Solea senegalensis]
MARDVSRLCLCLTPPPVTRHRWVGSSLGSILPSAPLRSLIFYYFLSCAASTGSFPAIEHSYAVSPKFVCTPIPPEADPSCYSPPSVPHGPSANGHSSGGGGGSWRGTMSDEAKATILHLRESLVRQKETILDQRETIRELTAKLTLCEGFGGHHDNYHDNHRDNHDNHHDDDDHHGPHGSHHTSLSTSSHHAPHSSDHHAPHSSDHHAPHSSDHHAPHRKSPSFSPEQTGKTLQTLKERLENLQARNSSSSYSSSLRELLQRKINALEEQLHSYHRDHHDDHYRRAAVSHDSHHLSRHGTQQRSSSRHDSHHDDHHGSSSRHDSHHDDHHDDHHSTGHRDNHHNNNHHGRDRYKPHSGHHSRQSDYDHRYDWQHGRHYGYHDNHRSDHHNDHHDDDHHEPGYRDDHHDSHHGNAHHPQRQPFTNKETGHGKLETVLSQLHHGNDHKKPKSPSSFLLDFPMKTNYMYGRMRKTVVNEIFALTVCLWLKAGAGPGLGTPFSYAVPGQANELVLMEWGSNPMELLINDKAVTLPVTMTDRKWHHVCVTWWTRDGVWEVFQDGVKKGSGQNLSSWQSVKPGGVFILGQEQDTIGGRFDVTQSFMGELADLQFWSRVLTPGEIHSQATCGGHLLGDVLSWSEGNVELHGGLSEFPFEPCH